MVIPTFCHGRHFLYERITITAESNGYYAGSRDNKPEQQSSKPLLTAQRGAFAYAPATTPNLGYLLFEREGALMAQSIDPSRVELMGTAFPITEGIANTGPPTFSASANGILVYRSGLAGSGTSQLLWFDRQGKPLGQFGQPGGYGQMALTPDGRNLVVSQREGRVGAQHTWVGDLACGVFSRLNPGNPEDYSAAVSPDGRIAFSYTIGGVLGDIYLKPLSGAGSAEPLVQSKLQKHPNHWSLDGRFLIYDEHHPTQNQDLWIVPMSGNDHKPVPFLVTPADETFGQFSPDTKWVAYSSDESGRREVYVQGFVPDKIPAAGVGKWQISTAGGDKPRWRRDGKELYYIARDGKMMAVPVKSTGAAFEPGVPIPLFETHVTGFAPYDVATDGRFLLNTLIEESPTSSTPFTVVLNWQAALKK